MALSMNRVKTIMKSTSGAEIITKESVQIVIRATELFMRKLVIDIVASSKNKKRLDYPDITRIVHADQLYYFIREIIPKKITLKEYKALIALHGGNSIMESSSDSSSDDEDSQSSASGNDTPPA